MIDIIGLAGIVVSFMCFYMLGKTEGENQCANQAVSEKPETWWLVAVEKAKCRVKIVELEKEESK
jgi:hypothetical protein